MLWALHVRTEVMKQWDAGFLKVVSYPEWLSNIVLIPKKDSKVRMCVDYRDLNKASPNDDFPLLHVDILVDNTAGHGQEPHSVCKIAQKTPIRIFLLSSFISLLS